MQQNIAAATIASVITEFGSIQFLLTCKLEELKGQLQREQEWIKRYRIHKTNLINVYNLNNNYFICTYQNCHYKVRKIKYIFTLNTINIFFAGKTMACDNKK
jgi:hypothetical protein